MNHTEKTCCPLTRYLSLYIEALKDMVSGKNNKVIYLPYEATGILGALGGIGDLFQRRGKGSQSPPAAQMSTLSLENEEWPEKDQ